MDSQKIKSQFSNI